MNIHVGQIPHLQVGPGKLSQDKTCYTRCSLTLGTSASIEGFRLNRPAGTSCGRVLSLPLYTLRFLSSEGSPGR